MIGKDKRGRLTSYAFACGAVERFGGVVLEREHGVYHCKVTSEALATKPQDYARWQTARTLKDARRVAAAMRRDVRSWKVQP